jgi:hypothetical protein
MRISFLAFVRALTTLPLLFVPVTFSQTDDCRVIDSPTPCVNSGTNFARCITAGTCGTNCTSPAPGPSWTNVVEAIQDSVPQCLEDVIAVAATGKEFYGMFASRYAEGLYSAVVFFSGNKTRLCNFSEIETGGFIGCSSCGTYTNSGPCLRIASHPAPCSTTAECIPRVCPRASVAVALGIDNPCLDPAVLCQLSTEADGAGVFGQGECVYAGFLQLLYGFKYEDCDGGADFQVPISQPCPTF